MAKDIENRFVLYTYDTYWRSSLPQCEWRKSNFPSRSKHDSKENIGGKDLNLVRKARAYTMYSTYWINFDFLLSFLWLCKWKTKRESVDKYRYVKALEVQPYTGLVFNKSWYIHMIIIIWCTTNQDFIELASFHIYNWIPHRRIKELYHQIQCFGTQDKLIGQLNLFVFPIFIQMSTHKFKRHSRLIC